MDTNQTLENLLAETGLADYAGCISCDQTEALPAQERHYLQWGHDKIGADGVILQRMTIKGSCFPLAYFRRLESAKPESIAQAHRLAWNMGLAPLLLVVLPGKVLAYSTYERPRMKGKEGVLDDKAGLIDTIDFLATAEQLRQTLRQYKREELLSGRFWETNRRRFSSKNRVEKSLIENLHSIRSYLIDQHGLDAPIVHRLLGRAIFIQYLHDRKDRNGHSAFPNGFLDKFVPGAKRFPDILSNKAATYDLFRCLEEKFNGDIFPVDDAELTDVDQDALDLLAEFLRGNITLRSRQLSFWPYYSFDAIPIEFISNMYEEFFHSQKEEEIARGQRKKKAKQGTYYTRHRLVEFMLDEVLPWEGTNTDLRILDPACGSGIFLVEAYRRLIARWQQKNGGSRPDARTLKALMTDNLFGVDNNPEAIRVAAFSLQLTMCDYLEPRYVWRTVTFPNLRGVNLWDQDFFGFAENPPQAAGKFDLVVGNPPWESELSEEAEAYIRARDLPVGDKQVAQAFLWVAPDLCKEDGTVSLIAPSKGLLFNASKPNRKFRKQFFSSHRVRLIVNFSALRKTLFAKAVGPAAPIVYQPGAPGESHEVVYCCPKPWNSPEDAWHYIIEDRDITHIPAQVAAEHPFIWKTAMWGGPRDWELISRLTELPSLQAVADERRWIHAEGYKVGTREQEPADWLTGKPHVEPNTLGAFVLDENTLPPLQETRFYHSAKTKKRIFQGPHLLIRQSPSADGKFTAAFLLKDAAFSQSILGISAPPEDLGKLGAICATLATDICTYFAMMTSSRWLVERDELEKAEVMATPLPSVIPDGRLEVSHAELTTAARNTTARAKLIRRISKAYGLGPYELALIRDAVTYTLDYFRKGSGSEAAKSPSDEMLCEYAEVLCETLNASFGRKDKRGFCAALYRDDSPMIVMRMSLSQGKNKQPVIRQASEDLAQALQRMDAILLEEQSLGVYVRRNVRVYEGKTIYVAKRDQCRLWNQSAALREADEIYADIMRGWGQKACQ